MRRKAGETSVKMLFTESYGGTSKTVTAACEEDTIRKQTRISGDGLVDSWYHVKLDLRYCDSALITVTPHTQCRLKLLKLERIKDYLLMEEEFIRNQEQMKPLEEKQEVRFK